MEFKIYSCLVRNFLESTSIVRTLYTDSKRILGYSFVLHIIIWFRTFILALLLSGLNGLLMTINLRFETPHCVSSLLSKQSLFPLQTKPPEMHLLFIHWYWEPWQLPAHVVYKLNGYLSHILFIYSTVTYATSSLVWSIWAIPYWVTYPIRTAETLSIATDKLEVSATLTMNCMNKKYSSSLDFVNQVCLAIIWFDRCLALYLVARQCRVTPCIV